MQLSIYRSARESHDGGFTLVETLVAVTILLVVIVGPMRIAQKGMQSSYYAGEQTTATYLAQEAIEYILLLRDNNALTNFQDWNSQGNDRDGNTWSWYTGLIAACKGASGCDIDLANNTFRDCSTLSNCKLNTYNKNNDPTSLTRLYRYQTGGNWTQSPYTRQIRVGTSAAAEQLNNSAGDQSGGGVPVTVTVTWDTALLGGTTKSIVLQTYVYDIYSKYE